MHFSERIRRFLYGRYIMYGLDTFTKLIFGICILLAVINLFIGSLLVYLFQTALFIYCFFRLFSRNIPARQAENRKAVRLFSKIKSSFSGLKRRFNERKTHIYKTCPHCKAKLRFRRIAGEHNAKCPRCKGNFKVKVR